MNKKLLIFDVDGVLFDSLPNMKIAWYELNKIYGFNIPFKMYASKIGIPFIQILKELGIKEKHNEIRKIYFNNCLKNQKLIKPFKDVIKVIKKLKLKNIKMGIVTSKDKKNLDSILTTYDLHTYINTIKAPNNIYRSKPCPDNLLYIMAKNNVDPSDTVFVGDMKIDYLTAKRANIDYIHAIYGYGNQSFKTKYSINAFDEILNFI